MAHMRKVEKMNSILNFGMFYLGWFACVGGAGRGRLWIGPLVVALLISAHLSLSAERKREIRLIAAIGLFGFVVDTLQASAGLYAFSRTSSVAWLCPPWMVALWMIFATTLNNSMAWLAGRYRLAAALGALFGPISYAAGARLGAIDLQPNPFVSLFGVAMVWAFAMPTLLALRELLFEPEAISPPRRTRRPASPGRGASRQTPGAWCSREKIGH